MSTINAANAGGYIGQTAEPQAFDVKVGKVIGQATSKNAEHLAKTTAPPPPVRVTTIDGVPTVVPRAPLSDHTNVGQRVSDDDMRAMGVEVPRFPRCEFPRCKEPAPNQIVNGSGAPLSINGEGELVFGKAPSIIEEGMTPHEMARARAGVSPIVGPSGVAMARQAVKCHVNVCEAHRTLPHAPKPPLKKREAGPFKSYFEAQRELDEIGKRTRRDPSLRSAKDRKGGDLFFVEWYE